MSSMLTALARYAGLARPAPASAPEAKDSAAAPLIALQYQRQPVWSPRDYSGFAREGFMQNPVVYRCVRMISEAAASVPICLYAGPDELTEHPLLDLLSAPNPTQSRSDLLEAWYSFLQVSGNAYMEAVALAGELRELYVLRPDRISIVPGADGWPASYDYTVAGHKVSYADDVLPGVRPLLHQALFHPANDYYGLSPIEAAATAIDIHNAASAWNKAMLDNSALPSGALVYTAADRQLTAEQYTRLKAELESSFQGARNAGRPMLLEGGLDWRAMSMSPKDMDFTESKRQAARDIALALGVPPMLLGIPGDTTHANYQEANRAFWRHSVLPTVGRTLQALSNWLGAGYGGGLELRADLDAIEALSAERDGLWARVGAATFLSDDEKRAAVGYGAGQSASAAVKLFDPAQPRAPSGGSDGGRWTGVEANGTGRAMPAQLDGPKQYSVDLREEEVDGGHTIRVHVGVSDPELLARVRRQMLNLVVVTFGAAEGAFASIESASDAVSRALQLHKMTVDGVAAGVTEEAVLNAQLGYVTGKEAFSDGSFEPILRPTFAVRVIIRHDRRSKRGYRVFTAFPVNPRPGENWVKP